MNNVCLTFKEYQEQALTTAVYPRQYVLMAGDTIKPNSLSCVYPVFGLCGEIGEVAQVLTNKLGHAVELSKECGDVLWYVAAICSDLSIDLGELLESVTFKDFQNKLSIINADTEDLLIELFMAAGIVSEATKKTIRDSDGIVSPERLTIIKAALKRVMIALTAICTYNVILLEGVARGNLEKLASRHKRGTISGSGDNR